MNQNNKLINYNNFSNILSQNLKVRQFILNEGNKIYKNNEFFRDLHNLMKNKEFKNFYDKYFKNWLDIETNVMFMKLYEKIKQSYKIKCKKEIDDKLLLFVLRQLIRENESRTIIMENFQLFKEGSKNKKHKKKLKILDK